MSDTVTFAGQEFTVAGKIGAMPLMRFARVARRGVDSNELEGLAAMYDLLEQCIDPGDWPRFERAADESRADGDELMAVVQDVMAVVSGRPTSRPSDSSDGSQTMSTSSPAGSSSPVIDRLVQRGRPDLALIVSQAEASRASA